LGRDDAPAHHGGVVHSASATIKLFARLASFANALHIAVKLAILIIDFIIAIFFVGRCRSRHAG
jgi:hypothetical protein